MKRASLGVFYPVSHHDPHRRGRRPHAYYLGFVKIEGGAAEAVLLTDRELSVFRARVDACWKNLTNEKEWPKWKRPS